jgi:lipoate---protein ligase
VGKGVGTDRFTVADMDMSRMISRKIRGGKLLRLELRFREDLVVGARLTGDFFIHPEEAIDPIEETLLTCQRGELEAEVKGRINQVLAENKATIIGFSADDLASMFVEAGK